MYHSKAPLFVSLKLVSLFHKAPPDGPWGWSLKRGGTFLDKAENTTCLIKFFSNWYSDLYKKWQYIGIFHPLRIFWCLKLRGQSISFCAASYLHGTPTRELHFCMLFVHRYLVSKWYHCTSFKLDILFVSYKLYLSRFYCQIFSRRIMWYFSNTTSCVYWIIYADYSFRATKPLKSQNNTAKQD